VVLDARPLRNFITVAELGSMTTASRRLFLSQPALSRQIKSLEREVGVPLFDRTRGSKQVHLTPAGEVFLAQARVLLAEMEKTQALVEETKASAFGLIRIGASPAALCYVVMPAVATFHQSWPDCRFEFTEANWGSELALVERGLVDLAVGHAVAGLRDVRWETLYTARLYALVAPGHRLAERSAVAVEELMQEDLLLFKGAPSSQIAHESMLHLHGFLPRSVFESQLPQTLLQAAASGLGVALLTDIVPFDGYELRAIPVLQHGRHYEAVRVVGWSRRRRLPDITRTFMQTLKEQADRSRRECYGAAWPA
jgi:DNA-binding transcriptional LysR family regulator